MSTSLPALLTVVATASGVQDTVLSGSMLLALPLAVLAGLVSFASPCVLPLVPGYLGFVTGMAGSSAGGARRLSQVARTRMVLGVGLFIGGFTLVFVTFGVLAGTLGSALLRYSDPITRVLGVVVVLMGLAFAGWVPFAQRERRWHVSPRAGVWGAPLLGIVFGLGWAPCIGPTLVAVYTLALDQASAGRGAVLSVAYCLGLGLPFVLIALGLERSARVLGVLRRHPVAIMRTGGIVLILVGLALVTGLWGVWTQSLQGLVGGFEPVV
ncbi:cytochrome c biogenesis CcdA family protein [Actinotalea sp.]|uniref:cytochrome c biogenesis CcdA family protein n=1 Tax=Actinotalea sp. TaxID=1872145 RepID=UPI00356AC0F1